MSKVFICPLCKSIKVNNSNKYELKCDKCNGIMFLSNVQSDEYYKIIRMGQNNKMKFIINEINAHKSYSSQPTEEPVRCPKCGSTQIQVLRKKWSPLTGILTNKVERVCVNCKKRF